MAGGAARVTRVGVELDAARRQPEGAYALIPPARALAPEWQASHYASSTHASASATVGGISYEVSIAREVPEPDRTPSEQFAAELTEQAAKAQRQQLEVDTLDRCPIFLGHDDDEGGSNRCAGPIGHKGSHDARSAVWA